VEFLPSAGTQGGVRHDEKAQNSGVTPTRENDFQIEQALSAEQAGRKLGIILEISYADNDAVNQSTQILTALQRGPQTRPDGIVFEPVGRDALPSGEPSGSGRRGGMGDLEPGSGHI
jgi:ABC-type sugar transport system substrate-binding protein